MPVRVRRLLRAISALALAAMALTVGPAVAEIEPIMAIAVNYPSGDISKIVLPTPDPGLCRQACDQNGQCKGWSFVKPGVQDANAVCWLKGTLNQEQFDQNAISGIKQVTYSPGRSARVEDWMGLGVDLPGGDLGVGGVLNVPDPAECAARCEANGQCQAWTFGRPGGWGQPAVCWLKGSIPTASANMSTISGRRRSGATGTGGGGGGFGVWAYVIGVNAGNFGDPCQIQYVAVAVAGNRYDADANYRRVRERPSMSAASADVTFFSTFMQDQPDNVVKFRPCSQATQLLPPRDGGPGTASPSPDAVWAYTIGTASFADPCAIQYVHVPIAGNRFDSNPRYRRVAENVSSSEGSRLVTRFSAFMEDQPDGVVKLISCAQSKATTTADNGNNGGAATNVAAWMTGTFNTNYGKMTLSTSGGSYEFDGGTLAVTRIDGATMEGRWTQKSKGGCGNAHGGRFSFTFTATGFSGNWGHCDQPLNQGSWYGTREQ